MTVSSFNAQFFAIQYSTYLYRLQDSSATTTDENDTLIVSLLAIKCFTSLVTRENNTLLAPRLGGVNDVYLNPLEPVLTSNATMVSE